MIWTENAIPILRILINDFGTEITYNDSILEQVLFVAGQYVAQEISLGTQYSFDFSTLTITPDPINDAVFINMTILKAACLNNMWKFNERVTLDGIKAKLGPASIDIDSNTSLLSNLITKGVCVEYEDLKKQINFGQVSRAILSPFINQSAFWYDNSIYIP